MVIVHKTGRQLGEVTLTVKGVTKKLSNKSDSKALFRTVEELSRVMLNSNKQRSFQTIFDELYFEASLLSPNEKDTAIIQLEILIDKIKNQ